MQRDFEQLRMFDLPFLLQTLVLWMAAIAIWNAISLQVAVGQARCLVKFQGSGSWPDPQTPSSPSRLQDLSHLFDCLQLTKVGELQQENLQKKLVRVTSQPCWIRVFLGGPENTFPPEKGRQDFGFPAFVVCFCHYLVDGSIIIYMTLNDQSDWS